LQPEFAMPIQASGPANLNTAIATAKQEKTRKFVASFEPVIMAQLIDQIAKQNINLCLITKQLIELDQNQEYRNEYYQNIDKLILSNDPEEESLNSFMVTLKYFNQPIEDIKGKQPQYNTKISIKNNRNLQQIIKLKILDHPRQNEKLLEESDKLSTETKALQKVLQKNAQKYNFNKD
ncbi:20237_t:CDS:2, partial [Gigaspora margarita]